MSRVANEIEFSHISFLNPDEPLSLEEGYSISCVVSLFIYRHELCLLWIERKHIRKKT